MEVETKVPWDVALEERLEREWEKYPNDGKRIRQERYHTRVFHERQWPDIQVELRERHQWVISDAEEPHWVEPWKASYWHKSVNLQGEVTWSRTQPLAADATSIARYLDKGMLLRSPEGAVVAELPAKPITKKLNKRTVCLQCSKRFKTARGMKKHMTISHRRE